MSFKIEHTQEYEPGFTFNWHRVVGDKPGLRHGILMTLHSPFDHPISVSGMSGESHAHARALACERMSVDLRARLAILDDLRTFANSEATRIRGELAEIEVYAKEEH